MPLLGGLFSRKNKSSSSPRPKRDDYANSVNSSVVSELETNPSSPTGSYVLAERPFPYSSDARNLLHPDSARELSSFSTTTLTSPSSSGSKLRIFGRKKSTLSGAQPAPSNALESQNQSRSPYTGRMSSSTMPEDDLADARRLRPPPSRSAIFAAYHDSNSSLSTRSLPNEGFNVPPESSHPPQLPTKRPSIFPWSKSSTPTTPQSSSKNMASLSPPLKTSASSPPMDSIDSSFNLRSFRHVRPPSPTNNDSSVSLSTPIPRPRGASVNSDSSQRISVAAFREVQAKRSHAGSPVPSFRSPSPGPGLPHIPPLSTDSGRNSPRPSRSSPHIPKVQERRRSSIAIAYTSDSGEESSEEQDSEDETLNRRSAQRGVATVRPGKGRARSEMGHAQQTASKSIARSPEQRSPKSHIGHSRTPSTITQVPLKNAPLPSPVHADLPPRSQSSLSNYGGGLRQRASVSTSALSPSAAAKRASLLIVDRTTSPPPANSSRPDSKPSSPTISVAERTRMNTAFNQSQSNISLHSRAPAVVPSDSDSEDDAPLATLVGPRRAGSALSSYSSLHSRSVGNVSTRSPGPHKPLIDINELTGGKRAFTLGNKNMDGFTSGSTLLSESKVPTSPHSPLSRGPFSPPNITSPGDDLEPLTSTVPPPNFLSPPGTPSKELDAYITLSSTVSEEKSPLPVVKRDSSPEQKRDLLTERLSKAVHRNLSPSPVADRTSSASKSSISIPKDPTPSILLDTPIKSESVGERNEPRPGQDARLPVPKLFVRDSTVDPSPPDQDLAQLLGAAARFISRNGESPSDSTSDSDESDSQSDNEPQTKPDRDRIAPIPIKQRSPPPAFAVTSRPTFPKRDGGSTSTNGSESKGPSSSGSISPRPRSTTLSPAALSSMSNASKPLVPAGQDGGSRLSSYLTNFGDNNASSSAKSDHHESSKPPAVRPRSTTMTASTPISVPPAKQKIFTAPERPFIAARRNSPASSTGDSSSGRAPLTPRDGSDIGRGDRKRDEWSGGASGLGVNGHIKRRSVSFEEDLKDAKSTGPLRSKLEVQRIDEEGTREVRRNERRRVEAKAAIELGNVINGPGPVMSDDEDDLPVNQALAARTSSLAPMLGGPTPMGMGFGSVPNTSAWASNMQPPMLSPAQFMIPPPTDPQFLAAHHHAMMIAKQAYQMAVAQQAMAAAGDEWERGSAIGGYTGSVYGGSTVSAMPSSPYGMMNMVPGNGWNNPSSVYLANSARSMYGGMSYSNTNMLSDSRSEYGGGNRGGPPNWSSSKSSYGDNFGPSSDPFARKGASGLRRNLGVGRDSGYFPSPHQPPPMPSSQGGRSTPDSRPPPRARTTSQLSSPSPSRVAAVPRKAPPPSSWRAGM